MSNIRKELVDILHQSNTEDRVAVYWGVAYGVVTSVLDKQDLEVSDIKVAVKDIVNEIAEMAIIDRVVLEKAMINLYSYFNMSKLSINYSNKLYGTSSIEDALFLNEFIGQSTMDSINSNVKLFSTTARIVTKLKADILEYSSLLKG
jgi:hypothetical protein